MVDDQVNTWAMISALQQRMEDRPIGRPGLPTGPKLSLTLEEGGMVDDQVDTRAMISALQQRMEDRPIGQPRLPTGPEPSLFDQRASFLESPVRTAPTQAVKRNPDRVQVTRVVKRNAPTRLYNNLAKNSFQCR